jgi:hypothetical protein
MNNKIFKDDTIRVTIEIYEELQRLWMQIGASLTFEHSAIMAREVARTLNLKAASNWLSHNPRSYEQAFGNGHWGLDTGQFDGNIICRSIGVLGSIYLTNVPRSVIQGSPDGHSWGYKETRHYGQAVYVRSLVTCRNIVV